MKGFANGLVSIIALVAGGATSASADCQSSFSEMMTAHLKAGPYHVSSKGEQFPFELDAVPPEAFHIREFSKDASRTARDEVIFTNRGGWMKSPGGNWQAIPDAAAAQVLAGFNATFAGGFKNPSDLTCQLDQAAMPVTSGKKAVASYIFKYLILNLHSGQQVPTTISILQGEDGLPMAMLLRTRNGDEAQDITYDRGIKVVAPVK